MQKRDGISQFFDENYFNPKKMKKKFQKKLNKLKKNKIKKLTMDQDASFQAILTTPRRAELLPEPQRKKALNNLATKIMLKWLKSPKFHMRVDSSEVRAILVYAIDYWMKYRSGEFDPASKKKHKGLIGVLEVEDSNQYPPTPKPTPRGNEPKAFRSTRKLKAMAAEAEAGISFKK